MGLRSDRELRLVGPFFTRSEAVVNSGLSPEELLGHPGVLRLGGAIVLQEVYAGFQFASHGLREDIAAVVEAAGPAANPWAVCDWMTRANGALGGKTPLAFLDEDGRLAPVVAAIHGD
jgi:hypothetical protein